MPLIPSRYHSLTHEEVNILVRASVIEKSRESKTKEDLPEIYSPKADELIKKAYIIQERANKETLKRINNQEPWIRDIMMALYREEQGIEK